MFLKELYQSALKGINMIQKKKCSLYAYTTVSNKLKCEHEQSRATCCRKLFSGKKTKP